MNFGEFLKTGFVAAVALTMLTSAAEAAGPNCDNNPTHPKCSGDGGGGGGGGGGDDLTLNGPNMPGSYYSWMHEDVGIAHSHNFTGAGSHMIIVDDHVDVTDGFSAIYGRLESDTVINREHGYWTSLEAWLVAPGASVYDLSWDSTARIETYFASGRLNAVNLSYGMFGPAGLKLVNLGTLNNSIVTAAGNGEAVFVKAAGNEWGAAVDGVYDWGADGLVQDYLNLTLIGKAGALFVGALQGNGTVENPAAIASYSTQAGGSKRVQKQFLVVGVDAGGTSSDEFANYGSDCGTVAGTCLYGTSFAAPIVTGYAAILGGKFTSATPDLIVDRLLDTARTDTIQGYSPSIHGQGEADLSVALAPDAIN